MVNAWDLRALSLAISVRAKVLARSSCSIFSGSELMWQYWRTCCFGKGRGNTETPSKLFTNHNAQGQLTNHNTFCFSEGRPSSIPELIEPFVSGWGERYCNNVNCVKTNAIFEPPSMSACSSTPPKQNQDFVKEHNRTHLNIKDKKIIQVNFPQISRILRASKLH